jgi:hypothetical protein
MWLIFVEDNYNSVYSNSVFIYVLNSKPVANYRVSTNKKQQQNKHKENKMMIMIIIINSIEKIIKVIMVHVTEEIIILTRIC